MKYLITGATGFIGPYLVNELVNRGHHCRCLIRKNSDTKPLEGMNIEWVEGDVTTPDTLKNIASGVDYVLHLATLGHMSNFTASEDMFNRVNAYGTQNIMREAIFGGVKKVIHCSSVAAMGICKDTPARETSECRPHHAYGRSKLKAEEEVLRMVREEKLPAVLLRFSMVYGPGDHRDMLKLVKMAKKGLFPKIGNRPKLTPLIHVRDAVNGILLAIEKGTTGETYLITNPRSEPFDGLRKQIQNALGIWRFPLYIPERAALWAASLVEFLFTKIGRVPPVTRKNIESTLTDRTFSIEKARNELGFTPGVDVTEGILDTVEWYKKHGWV